MERFIPNEAYYEDEIREGFYVSAAVKQAWAAELSILSEIDRVSEKLNIRYFASWGTFLGAVRHMGFVPWDDDLDICMLREDYDKFMAEGVSMLPEGFSVYDLTTKDDHDQFLANVVNTVKISFTPEHLRKFHGFPYIACVDIFVFDHIPSDKKAFEDMKAEAWQILNVSEAVRKGELSGTELRRELAVLKESLGIDIPDDCSDPKIRQLLDIEVMKLFSSFKDSESDSIVQMMPWGLKGIKEMPSYYYGKTVNIPFEEWTIPVPIAYCAALKDHYGDFVRVVKGAAAHEYPYFEKAKREFSKLLDFDMPGYRIEEDLLIEQVKERKEGKPDHNDTYRSVVNECLSEINRLNDHMGQAVSALTYEDIPGLLEDCQQLSIELGNYMEAIKGEGYDIVKLLERYCEEIYEMSVLFLSESAATEAKITSDINKTYTSLCETLERINDKVSTRKEVLFLPYKGKYFESLMPFYKKASEDEDTDVFVVPLPIYGKDYDGSLINMSYDVTGYPEEVYLTRYDEYDIMLHRPDIIYINSPYDQFNEATSIPPFYYSENLLKMTDRLVYVPWFKIKDFSKDDPCEYANMRYYCTMPGVVNADVTYVDSDALRTLYIEKLTEFAGTKTRSIWEEKIQTADTEGSSVLLQNGKEDIKTIAYYCDYSDIALYGEKALEKIKSSIEVFAENKDSVRCIFVRNKTPYDEYKKYEPGLFKEYDDLLTARLEKSGIEQVLLDNSISSDDYPDIVTRCDAFYGDPGCLAHLFVEAGKPVMIQSYDVI